MAIQPSHAFKKNLEKIGRDLHMGAWRISPLLDQVTEKRFLLLSLKARDLAGVHPSVLRFRGDAGHAIASDNCPPVFSLSFEGDKLEILTQHADMVAAENLAVQNLQELFRSVIRVLIRFERHHFFAGELSLEALALAEDGSTLVLPMAFVRPVYDDERVSAVDRLPAGPTQSPEDGGESTSNPLFATSNPHPILLGRLIQRVKGEYPDGDQVSDTRLGEFLSRLWEVGDDLENGRILSVAQAYERLFSELPVDELKRHPATPEDTTDGRATDEFAKEIVDRSNVDGSVTVLNGNALSGKTSILREVAAALEQHEGIRVYSLDELDLFASTRRRSLPRPRTPDRSIWIIDDGDEKGLPYSDFVAAMLESDGYPKGSLVVAVPNRGRSKSCLDVLEKLRGQRGKRYHEVTVPGSDPARFVRFVVEATRIMSPGTNISRDAKPTEAVSTFLRTLPQEERQILEFLSVARFAMPFDLVTSVFPESSAGIVASVLRLTCVDALELLYRRVAQKNSLTLFLRIRSSSLRRLVYDSIPSGRRRKLHRSVALVAEQRGSFPIYFLLHHCLTANEDALAARHAVAFLKLTKTERRQPYLVQLCVDLARQNKLKELPFSDQILTYQQVSRELIKDGGTEEAERLLVEARDLIENIEMDQKLKNASQICALYRLLADRWEARGEFTKALDLLDDCRDEFQSALPIPDQAQLLNDIGWLQYRLGDYDLSMESCRLSLNTLNPNQHPMIVAQALNLMGVVHFNTSRYDEAISYYEQSAYLRERSGDENALAASYNNLALAFQAKGEFEKALDHYKESLKLKTRQNNKAGIAGGYLNLALLYLESRSFKEAEAKCRESLAISEELGNAPLAADNYVTLGDIALEGGNFESAENYYKESYRISHEREAINEEMGALRRLSTLCLKQDRLTESRDYAEKAFRLVKRIGSKYENAQITVILGDLVLREDRPREALDHYEKAASQYASLSKYRLAATVLSKIGLIHVENANNFEARHYMDRAQDFVRADIGRELPEEYVELQHVLKAPPAGTQLVGKESQKLLMAFYDLSALTDYAIDRHEFFRKTMDVTQRIVDPTDCLLALKTGSNDFLLFNIAGDRIPVNEDGLRTLFRRSLVLGGLLDSTSSDVSDLLHQITLTDGIGFACIPLKAMSEEIGCLLLYLNDERLPLSANDKNFFTWIGRQISSSLKLMLHLNDQFFKDEITDGNRSELKTDAQPENQFQNLIGKSEAMKKIFRILEKVKSTDSGILILGESGTGKSALARAIHFSSPRKNRAFQEIHCAQIPHGLLESELFGHERGSFTGAVQRKLGLCEIADGGTLFLDDINVIAVDTQTKLLNFLESKSYMRLGGTQRLRSDVRIIAASNEDLEQLCREGRFREDLYYRLKVILIDLPPLRERKDDMLAIALDYLKKSCTEKGIPLKTLAPETIELFQKAPWRGNVRELQNVLERIVVLSEETHITPSALPEDFLREVMGTSRHSKLRLDELVDEIVKLGNYSESNPLLPLLEALLAKRMVDHSDGKTRAARLLGISKPTLYARLRDYDKMH